MEGFDRPRVYVSQNAIPDGSVSEVQESFVFIKKQFKNFLREFSVNNFNFIYRDALKRNYNQHKYYLEVSLQDLSFKNEQLTDKLYKQPLEYLPVFEEAATELAEELTAPHPFGEEKHIKNIQIMLVSNEKPTNLRSTESRSVSKLVKIPGIIIHASDIKTKATSISIQCRSCGNIIPNLPVKQGLDGFVMPRKCVTEQAGRQNCPSDPYVIIPEKCTHIDFQILKLQELSEYMPQGEMPRHLLLFCDRYLCERVVSGNRVHVIGVYSIKKVNTATKKDTRAKGNSGVRWPYMRVVGLQIDDEGAIGSGNKVVETEEEEEKFKKFASSSNVYEKLSSSIAPAIYGSDDIKKALLCLLFSGSKKILPDGIKRRGDINILLLGDPGTAKSQLLKFIEQVSPIGVYTSGKGSSAAGLTASVVRDPQTKKFALEGGAMVLGDGGIVCIDEFDKMREDDRVAIHEAMEQQTISIAKAGITSTLNARCSVLAAANSVFGRWDETKGDENINFMPTILSRFDMIFIVKDEYNQRKDTTLVKHVVRLHRGENQVVQEESDGDLSVEFIKKYVNYCKSHCAPRITREAMELLKRRFNRMRIGTGQHEQETNKRMAIPITIRQLEAITRIAESLAKMQLLPFASEVHVNEAMRLFQVSTLDAAMSGGLSGSDELSSEVEHEMLLKIEKQMKKRFAIGTQVSQQNIIYDFIQQQFPERAILKVIYTMIRRGQLQHRMQRKLLYRIC